MKEMTIDLDIIKNCISSNFFSFLRKYHKYDSNSTTLLINEEIIDMILYLLDNKDTIIEGLDLLYKIKGERISLYQEKVIIAKFELILSKTENISSIYEYTLNPILISIVISKILLSKYYSLLIQNYLNI